MFNKTGDRSRKRGQIICLSSTRWNFLWQRPQQIMSRLSQAFDVLYVDPPFPADEREINGFLADTRLLARRLHKVDDSLTVFSPLRISPVNRPARDSEMFRTMNAKCFARQLGSLAELIRWRQPLIWVYDPQAYLSIERLARRGLVYDCVDNFPAFSWADPLTAEWDRKLTAQADVVLASSLALYQERSWDKEATYLVSNAADYAHFAKVGSINGEAPQLAGIARPRLGFIGAIYEWVDLDLLATVAEARPDWQIVLIGPKQSGLSLPERPNIHWLGSRDYALLPLYLQGLAVMLIPFLRNEITDHTNPIKLWEYLAAGKPVVATALPEIPHVPEVIWQCDTPEEFIDGCAQALERIQDPGGSQAVAETARAVARANSWEEQCGKIREILAARFGM